MPDVPNVPGVPTLSSYSDSGVSLLVGDAFGAIIALVAPPWGVYIDGAPVFTPASVIGQNLAPVLSAISTIAAAIGLPNVVPVQASMVTFDYKAESPISNYPQQNGAFQSYDKVQMPYDVRLKLACAGDASQRQSFQDTLEALRTSTVLVQVMTPEKVFDDCNCTHVSFTRSSDSGVAMILADVWFEEVRQTSTATYTNTKSPTDAAPQSIGNVQPDTIPASVRQQYLNFGGAPT